MYWKIFVHTDNNDINNYCFNNYYLIIYYIDKMVLTIYYTDKMVLTKVYFCIILNERKIFFCVKV